MSTISNIHTAIVYESKGLNKSVAQFGQRGIVTIAKADKNGNYGQFLQQTMFTSVPQLSTNDIDFTKSAVQFHAIEYFKSIQNQIVADALKSGSNSVTTSQLSIDNIIVYLETVNSPEKWDSAKIASWFTENLAENLGVKLIEMGKNDADLERILAATSKRFADSFSSKAVISRKVAEELQKALRFANDTNDSQVLKFQARIDKTLKEHELSDSLDF